jgi:SAM-dependent methyltransferase
MIADVSDQMRGLQTVWSERDPSIFEHGSGTGGRVRALSVAARIIRDVTRQYGLVLDVGCGVGLLADYLGGVAAVGVDFSPSLLSRAKVRLPVAQDQPHRTSRQNDAQTAAEHAHSGTSVRPS